MGRLAVMVMVYVYLAAVNGSITSDDRCTEILVCA
jgi:hypothetical protein